MLCLICVWEHELLGSYCMFLNWYSSSDRYSLVKQEAHKSHKVWDYSMDQWMWRDQLHSICVATCIHLNWPRSGRGRGIFDAALPTKNGTSFDPKSQPPLWTLQRPGLESCDWAWWRHWYFSNHLPALRSAALPLLLCSGQCGLIETCHLNLTGACAFFPLLLLTIKTTYHWCCSSQWRKQAR